MPQLVLGLQGTSALELATSNKFTQIMEVLEAPPPTMPLSKRKRDERATLMVRRSNSHSCTRAAAAYMSRLYVDMRVARCTAAAYMSWLYALLVILAACDISSPCLLAAAHL